MSLFSDSMDELLPQMLSFPPHPPPPQPLSDVDYDRSIKGLVQNLNQVAASKLTSGVSGGGDLLDILDPKINTLPYLYTLLAHIAGPQAGKQANSATSKLFAPSGALWLKMVEFMDQFDPVQVRYAGQSWRRLVETVAKVARAASNPMVAVQPIRTAMLRLDPTTSCFTSTHTLFARLCLEARAYRFSCPILDNDIYHFPTSLAKNPINAPLLCAKHDSSSAYINSASGLSDTLNHKDHLQYFLYGAMLYIGMKRWDRALLFLEFAIISPTGNTASMIQVEAYKKWVLLGLVLKGSPLPMPRTTNAQAARLYRSIAKPYDAIAEVFKEGDASRLRQEFEVGRKVWQDDCNTGLLLQVLEAFRRFAVKRLEKTYAALSVSEIARRTSPDPNNQAETEHYLSSLIANGYLNATLIQSSDLSYPSILRFATSPTTGPLARSEAQAYEELVEQTARISKLTEHIKETDRRLAMTKEYIDWAKRTRKQKDAGGSMGELNHMIEMAGDDYGGDEDMMADL
ncbi:MAG: hypothetical protein FRX48_03124 [Lasallia pustulata]|uniref:COP9 signalosome complex subunit 3 N-terminal helical repeats domain-containing protein n=1 Tax=Lasallia pustulata TaxID=136370 RepID=A0A5M8PUQ9_9LECA|nr:MAG: hypothetical protein FRX48_03124 [Lasallia pustulata]